MIKLKTTMKKASLFFTILALFFSFTAPTVLALPQDDIDAINGGWTNWKVDSGSTEACLGGAAGSGPLVGPRFPKVDDTAEVAQKLRTYMQQTLPSSPLVEFANYFVSMGQKYDVNPAMAVLFAQKETSLATRGNGPPPEYNFYNERSSRTPGGWRIFADYKDAIDHYYQLISGHLYLGPTSNFTTVDQILNRFAPPSDGNDTSGYIEFVKAGMVKILSGSVVVSADEVAETSSSCGSGVTSEGAYGWNIVGAHAMVNFDQTNPEWSSHPYGAGKTSLGESGCGPTSIAMVAATLLNDKSITPVTIGDRYGARYHSDGTEWGIFPVFANDYSLKMRDLGTDLKGAADILRTGGLVIISAGTGYFTSQGHFMVLRAVTADGVSFYIADPNGDGIHNDSETRAFSTSFLAGEGHMKHLWGFTK